MVRAESLPQRGTGRDELRIDGLCRVVNGQVARPFERCETLARAILWR
jgi:hypothetical protein